MHVREGLSFKFMIMVCPQYSTADATVKRFEGPWSV